MISVEKLRRKMNFLGKDKIPFIFGVDYELKNAFIYTDPINCKEIYFNINGYTNFNKQVELTNNVIFRKFPISFKEYKQKFDISYEGLKNGDSFLLNLTVSTPIETNLSLEEIFYRSKASFKLFLPNTFTCFSPESFIKIKDGKIYSYPMKGTIKESIKNARNKILNDYKETSEHYTIVDLIRNDLNSICKSSTKVKRFRYIDKIHTKEDTILQVSSEIESELDLNYNEKLGDILISLLPAGSICGAPKQSTLKIIKNAENNDRGFYTGVFGYFDGTNLESAVLIRFIEKKESNLYFRSGGGITINSDAKDEYLEVIDKIYLPI